MTLRQFFLGSVAFEEGEEYFAFKYAFALLTLWLGLPTLGLFILGDTTGANNVGWHGITIRVYFWLHCVLILALRNHKAHFKPVVWALVASTFLVHLSGFMFVPADESRLVWFYSLVAGVYILLGRRAGVLLTVASMVAVGLFNEHVSAPLSPRGMGTFQVSMVSMSVIFYAFTSRSELFHKTMVASNARLRHLSSHDPLTGLLNSRAFTADCERLIKLAGRQSLPYAVLFIDLDHFKRINDQHGHEAGDTVLRAVAACMLKRLRQSDLLGRVGGEEFVAFLPATDVEGAAKLAEALRGDVQALELTSPAGDALRVTASIGVASVEGQVGEAGAALEDLQRQADQAMYQAKAAGRNRVTVFGAEHVVMAEPSVQA